MVIVMLAASCWDLVRDGGADADDAGCWRSTLTGWGS